MAGKPRTSTAYSNKLPPYTASSPGGNGGSTGLPYGEELARLQTLLKNELRPTEIMATLDTIREDDGCDDVDFSLRMTPLYGKLKQRDAMVKWLHNLTEEFNCHLDIFYRSALLLDAFLFRSKCDERLYSCTSMACFIMAVRLHQNTTDDYITQLQCNLISRYKCSFKRRDLAHMEQIIYKDLHCNLLRPTIQDFIASFHSLAMSSQLFHLPGHIDVPTHLNHLYKCTQYIVCDHNLMMRHRPSILALAVIGCDLKLLNFDWLSVILSLETLVQVKGGELSVCYEAVAAEFPGLSILHPLPLSPAPPKPPRYTWRELVLNIPADEGNEGNDEADAEHQREDKRQKRRYKRRYRPPLCRTVNVAIV